MRTVSDMEQRLRATSVDPGVRQERFDALRAELQSRMRTRRYRPLFVAAASIVFICLVTFQDQPLESFNYRLDYFAGEENSIYSFMSHRDASTSWGFSKSVGDLEAYERAPMTPEEIAHRIHKTEITQAMFEAGLLEPTRAYGHTWKGQTTYSVIFTGESGGLELQYTSYIDDIIHPEHTDFMVNHYGDIYMAAFRGELSPYASQVIAHDSREFILHGWRHEDPVYGEVIIWTTQDFN